MDESMIGPLALAVTFAGAAAGLVRAYIAHRTRWQAEREASARAAARMNGLMGLAGTHHDVVRIVERDRDGHREVELGGPAAPLATESEAA
ncbi:hypothetical protein OWR29_32535 [Actinoplanes sp. Pm04-4]|uniref:Secreted protein n=1 Tax=Paractinoplanes pyxinae TaxID=2997416 RepID=A0ABT4B8B5_9ACTN|nr:hypothetical protein [Actinoplanes pyxinae]MCY1142747.1 hypothetical protein [Actinoplanes pyxinae]